MTAGTAFQKSDREVTGLVDSARGVNLASMFHRVA
jgi:hypothetical protein